MTSFSFDGFIYFLNHWKRKENVVEQDHEQRGGQGQLANKKDKEKQVQ